MKYAKMVKMTAMCKKDQEGRMLSDTYPRLPKALDFGVEAEAKRPYKNEVVIKTLKFKAFGRTAALWDQVWSNIIVEKNDSQGTISKAIALISKHYEIWVLSRKFGSFSRKFGSFHANLGPFHGHSVLIGSNDFTERAAECAS